MDKSDTGDSSRSSGETVSVIFAAYAANEEQLQHALYFAESVRTFAGRFRTAPIWLYMPGDVLKEGSGFIDSFESLKVELRISDAPPEALRFYYAGKVYAAGDAETAADGKTDVLVWVDEDTVVLDEPGSFHLPDSISFAYRPVMHNRSGSAWDRPPDAFWRNIYDRLAVTDADLFPMTTPADNIRIRAYFNAGLLIVRPERGILRKWSRDFEVLYTDSVLADMCDKDIEKKVFIHQTALVGAVLNTIPREEIMELSDRYNYPIFFHRQYDAAREFGSIEDIITLRYDVYFRSPDPDWREKLRGPQDRVDWLVERLSGS